ncbi:hypothetical protein GGTG_03507 [Gaeumannomyces tritici R3-111a-1]|uniref:Uncharacterized protein n=1 Tax=Gaeumannomyces tritici (strain R3-111a-1) TaxID=644352 RepID=J3NQF0_GAET3|nr:hypothetical protein GGTG_03507 [Gaeumannomyces tritici R3-111a-1]EJT78406.1 hypothetical protein GGTG_03507 [Gaeumannomyces tritici R3-111a-1]
MDEANPPMGKAAFPMNDMAFPMDDAAFLMDDAAFPMDDAAFPMDDVAFQIDDAGFLIDEASPLMDDNDMARLVHTFNSLPCPASVVPKQCWPGPESQCPHHTDPIGCQTHPYAPNDWILSRLEFPAGRVHLVMCNGRWCSTLLLGQEASGRNGPMGVDRLVSMLVVNLLVNFAGGLTNARIPSEAPGVPFAPATWGTGSPHFVPAIQAKLRSLGMDDGNVTGRPQSPVEFQCFYREASRYASAVMNWGLRETIRERATRRNDIWD